MFFFDTEDFTCDESNDAIRDTARILTEEGVVGEYNIVGYLARELERNHRTDVIDALKPHAIGTQTLGHSVHPTICELSDMPDWNTAYGNVVRTESEGIVMLKSAFGIDSVDYAVPPGNSWSYASLYAFADMGITFYGGGGFVDMGEDGTGSDGIVPPGLKHEGMWYCNLLQIPYSCLMALEALIPNPDWPLPDLDKILDKAAQRDLVVFYMHPHMAIKTAHWDGPNYKGANLVPWGEWKQIANRPKDVTEEFYRNFRAFVCRVKSDDRFEVTDIFAEKSKIPPRKVIHGSDFHSIRIALERHFGSISEPASWCLADVFQAVVRALRGEGEQMPGKVYGFLEQPAGVTEPVTVRADDLRAAASKIDLSAFIPSTIPVGDVNIGPADFLFAGLEVIDTGAETIRVTPREQLGDFSECPTLATVDIKAGWCIHSPDLNGKLLDERLRLQYWTLRYDKLA